MPIALTLGLYFYGIVALQNLIQLQLRLLLGGWGLDPSGWAAWISLGIVQIALIIAGALTFSLASGVVSSPFNDSLAEAAESRVKPPLPVLPPPTIRARARLILIDLLKTVAAAIASITALLLSLIPVLNVIAWTIAFLFLCFQYTSYAQTRRGIGLVGGLGFLWRHVYAATGLGACLMLLFAIPLVSSLAIPIAVVAGTWLVARTHSPSKDFPLPR